MLYLRDRSAGFGVQFRIWSSDFGDRRVNNVRFRAWDLGFRVYDLGFRASDLGFRVYDLGFRAVKI